MSFHNLVIISFHPRLQKLEELKALAGKFAEQVPSHLVDEDVERGFLESLSTDRTTFRGTVASVCLWGGDWSGFNPDDFLEDMQPFFTELYKREILANYSRIVIFWEMQYSVEQGWEGNRREPSYAAEIRYNVHTSKIVVARHDLPFNWGV